MLSREEEKALCFYEGDVEQTGDPFFSDAKAYVTWNALLFDGMETEYARIREGRRLNPAFLCDPERVIALSLDLIRSFSHMPKRQEEMITYRVERLIDYRAFCSAGRMTSFISTSCSGFLNSYRDKEDLVLMIVHISPEIPCGDLGYMLEEYRKAEETEILLAPYLIINSVEKEISDSLKTITDRNGNPPAVVCDIYPEYSPLKKEAHPEWLTSEYISASVSVYEALNAGRQPEENIIRMYLKFKQALQAELLERMGQL